MDPVMTHNESDLPAPPRLLLWLAVGLFVLIVLVVIGVVIFYAGGQRMRALFPYVIALAALLPVVAIGGSILFRKRLPRLFLIWVVIAIVFVYTGAAFAGIYALREIVPPRYQEEILGQVPFLQRFMRPTPAGGVIPTVASTSAIAPEDLLSLSLSDLTTEEATEAVVQEE